MSSTNSEYPNSFDTFPTPDATDKTNGVLKHSDLHQKVNNAIEAIQSALGAHPQGAYPTTKARMDNIDSEIANLKAVVTGGDVEAIVGPAGEGVPTGGSTGQILAKNSATDYDTTWITDTSAVSSVNGQTGAVTLDADDIAETGTNKIMTSTERTKLSGLNITQLQRTISTDATLLLTDAEKLIVIDGATITVPPNASVAFPVGTVISLLSTSSDAATIVGGAGVTVNTHADDTAALDGPGATATLVKTATNTWWLTGNHLVAPIVETGSFAVDWDDVRDVQWGFAEDEGITGGFDGTPYVITSLADTGTGTLRAALAGSGSNKYISFSPLLQGGTINLASNITCTGSNITLDGVGRGITIRNWTLRFEEGTNYIVAGLHFADNNGNPLETDAITFRKASPSGMLFGVYNCSYENGADGELDIIWKRDGDMIGTVAGNHFFEHNKTMLINSGNPDGVEENDVGAYYITIADCVFDKICQRTPLARDGHVHLYNALVSRYADANSGGTPTRMGVHNPAAGFVSGLLAENCIAYPLGIGEEDWEGNPGVNTRESWFSPSGTGGNMKAVGTLLMTNAVDGVTTATETEMDPHLVFTPPYSGYPLATATTALRTFLLSCIGSIPAKKSTISGYINPAASHGFIAQNQVVTAKVEGDVPDAVVLLFDDVTVATLANQGAGIWTGTVTASIPAPNTIGVVKVRASEGATISESPEYAALVLPDL